MRVEASDHLSHYGTLHKSGRYPWGSGGSQSTRNRSLLDSIELLKAKGLSDVEIAKGLGMKSTTELVAAKSIASTELKQDLIRNIESMADRGMSNVAIGDQLGYNESTIRSLRSPAQKAKLEVLESTANMLKAQIAEKGYIDIGAGVENQLKISKDKLKIAVTKLELEGYKKHYVKQTQLTTGKDTSIKVLGAPGSSYPKKEQIRQIVEHTEDHGKSWVSIQTPISISSKRISVRYAEDGGGQADGVIFVRPGVKKVSIGENHYAQVRIAVDGTHYLKGMAVYKDNLPEGVDLVFNTNKKSTGKKHDAMKPIKDDPDNPFGSIIRQIHGPDGKVVSAMNIVGSKEGSGVEGGWGEWSKSLSSQILSKQEPDLAKQQLAMTHERMKSELAEIMALTNPSVRRKLLESFADGADASSIKLDAAHLPGQATHVILPVNSMKKNEIYAPNYNNGERVALIRYPHGGTFEIPELTVNNRNAEAKKMLGLGNPRMDAVGIHHSVAEHLSGADFDGDTVLVIPNNKGSIKSRPPLEVLKTFDPQDYKIPDGSPTPHIKPERVGYEMGDITNLIADMTIRGANTEELSRAVRHSMVVIDAEKGLDYKASARDRGIAALKRKYQVEVPGGSKGGAGGASTLITRAGSKQFVPERRARRASEGGSVDPATGKKMFVNTGATYVDRNTGKVVRKQTESKKLAETDDAHTLSSGTTIERIYADHSNRLKGMANEARKEALTIRPTPYSKQAKATYAGQVATLNSKLNIALKNAPLERQAQVIGDIIVSQLRQATPNMSKSDVKKAKQRALIEARLRVGAHKERIDLTQHEWDAIQAGAISPSKLDSILKNTDLERIKKLATPRTPLLMTSTKKARAQSMLAQGYTQAEVAAQLGVSKTTLLASIS